MADRLLSMWPAGIWLIYAYLASDYGFGNVLSPGPGMFPALLAVLGTAVTVVRGVAARPPAITPRGTARQHSGGTRAVLFCTLMAVVLVLAPFVGQALAMVAFAGVSAWLMGVRRWWTLVCILVGSAAMVEYGFGHLLGIPLARGSWFR